jgi:uncharacterized protein
VCLLVSDSIPIFIYYKPFLFFMRCFSKFVLLISVFVLLAPIVFCEDASVVSLVNDFAHVLNDSDRASIESVLSQIYNSGNAQFSVVIVQSLGGWDIESYSLELAQNNLGDSEKDNGLLLLVALDNKKYRFEVGRGL